MTRRPADIALKQAIDPVIIFPDEKNSKRPKKSYITNKTDFYHNDDTWSLDILDSNDYSPENKRSYTYILVVIDNFSKTG